METRMRLKNRQGGAVAVMVGISMILLVGFLAMVIDLGHLYIAKTELQTAADAAALSGAKQLNGTRLGINNTNNDCNPPTNSGAVQCAIATAAKNNYDFSSTPVDITIADIWVGDCPDDSCMVAASSITDDAAAAGKTFVKVHTRNRNMTAWFAPIWSIFHISTFGMAVAGKYVVDVTPIAICNVSYPVHIDPATGKKKCGSDECGYERGVSYRVSDFNPIGPGTMYWIDPQSVTPGVCTVTSADDTRPYICVGKTAFTPIVGQQVNTNTGVTDPQLAALDSRFGDYPSKGQCDPATAPPDSNIREYSCTNAKGDNGCLKNPATGIVGLPRDWMNPNPVQQSISCETQGNKCAVPVVPETYSKRTFADYGVLWSAYRPNGKTVSDWSALYKGNATSYPEPAPYAQTSGDFFLAPSANGPGKQGRRVLNMTIIDCTTTGGVCRPADVMGVGKYFMQKRADTASDKNVYVEFGGLLPEPFSPADIRLYR